jgi:hypothetical protein
MFALIPDIKLVVIYTYLDRVTASIIFIDSSIYHGLSYSFLWEVIRIPKVSS